MAPPDRSRQRGALDRVRRLRGVTWEWRPGAPIDRGAREAGVIAQDVLAVLPDLVERGPNGYLHVDYGGVALECRDALLELSERIVELEPDEAAAPTEPVEAAIANLRSGELRPTDQAALVGILVEAVKELDRRLAEIERRVASERG